MRTARAAGDAQRAAPACLRCRSWVGGAGVVAAMARAAVATRAVVARAAAGEMAGEMTPGSSARDGANGAAGAAGAAADAAGSAAEFGRRWPWRRPPSGGGAGERAHSPDRRDGRRGSRIGVTVAGVAEQPRRSRWRASARRDLSDAFGRASGRCEGRGGPSSHPPASRRRRRPPRTGQPLNRCWWRAWEPLPSPSSSSVASVRSVRSQERAPRGLQELGRR